jgi:hypothetical protein
VSRRTACAAVLVAMGLAPACGYALVGRGNTLPTYVRIIGVPQFENHSPVENVDTLVTEEVRREFQSRGSLRTVPDDQGVDALMKGTIVRVDLQPIDINAESQGTRYLMIVTANVEFRDQRDGGKVLWSNPSMTMREEYELQTVGSAADPAAVFRQDQNALQRLARAFARSVVTAILTGD